MIARALAKKPEERWPSCREFARALATAARLNDESMPADESDHLLTSFRIPNRLKSRRRCRTRGQKYPRPARSYPQPEHSYPKSGRSCPGRGASPIPDRPDRRSTAPPKDGGTRDPRRATRSRNKLPRDRDDAAQNTGASPDHVTSAPDHSAAVNESKTYTVSPFRIVMGIYGLLTLPYPIMMFGTLVIAFSFQNPEPIMKPVLDKIGSGYISYILIAPWIFPWVTIPMVLELPRSLRIIRVLENGLENANIT